MASAKKSSVAPKEDTQLKLLYSDDSQFKYWTSHLFNEVYLKRDLADKHADLWNNTEENDFQLFLKTVRDLAFEYKNRDKELSTWSETETINNWVKHILSALGWANNCSGVQNPFLEETSFRVGSKTYRTDILIVDHPSEKQYINRENGDERLVEARNSVIMPVEVKYWNRLEQFRQGQIDEAKRSDSAHDELSKTATPNEQIVQYMNILQKDWGILTDGAHWRLFNRDLSSEDPNRYYDFNLYGLIQSINTEETETDRLEVLEATKYFYHFFAKKSFAPEKESSESFCNEILRYSKKYVSSIEEDLKTRFVQAMNLACNAFAKSSKKNGYSYDLDKIRNVSESVLFNLLFLRSLESRAVLPITSTDYRKISLSSIFDKIERFDHDKDDFLNLRELKRSFGKGNGNAFDFEISGDQLHDRILKLNQAIHGGTKKDKFGFEIMAFTESVFADSEWDQFKNCKIENGDWVKILFQLGYAKSESKNRKYQQIPYGYFTPRQLGSIYESFLEFKIQTAPSDMIFIKGQWIEVTNKAMVQKFADSPFVKKGDLFFTPDNEDRKVSGAYYTPDYIVQYIVDETLSAVTKDLTASELLNVKICDPAMGSGHFLVASMNFLSREYLKKLNKESKGTADIDVGKAKRTVLKHCIHGIDINHRAAKLAKMSLWLETAHINEKLEDLRDQLKVTNSLGNLDLWGANGKEKGSGRFAAIVGNPPYVDYRKLSKSDVDLCSKFKSTQVKEKWSLYVPFVELGLRLLKPGGLLGYIIPNTWLSSSFGVGLRKTLLEDYKIERIEDVSTLKVFGPKVATYPVLLFVGNDKVPDGYDFDVCIRRTPQDLLSDDSEKVSSRELLSTTDSIIQLDMTVQKTMSKIESMPTTFGDYVVEMKWGTSATGYGKKKISEEEYRRLSEKEKSKYRKIIQTSDIKIRKIEWQKEYIPTNVFSENQKELFVGKKLVIARVTKTIQAAIDDKDYYVGKSSVATCKNANTIKALAVLLTSRAVNFWFYKKFNTVHMANDYIRFDIPYLKQIPVPQLSDSNIKELAELYAEKQDKIDKFVYGIYGLSKAEISEIESHFDAKQVVKKAAA